MEKREAAQILYLDGVTQVDISKLLKVSEQTIVVWVREGKWKEQRIKRDVFETTATEGIQELILYQLEVVKRKTKRLRQSAKHLRLSPDGEWKELEEGLIPSDQDELNLKPVDSKDIESLQKLFNTIKRQELRWDECVRLLRRFADYLQTHDLDVAKAILPHAEDFLNELRKQLNR